MCELLLLTHPIIDAMSLLPGRDRFLSDFYFVLIFFFFVLSFCRTALSQFLLPLKTHARPLCH